jgi:hypothetical protein
MVNATEVSTALKEAHTPTLSFVQRATFAQVINIMRTILALFLLWLITRNWSALITTAKPLKLASTTWMRWAVMETMNQEALPVKYVLQVMNVM